MKVYLAGPVTGIKNHNQEKFARVKSLLEKDNFDIVSPFDLNIKKPPKNCTPQFRWNYYMGHCLSRILKNDINMLFLLEGWEHSKGACTEAYVANNAGIVVMKVFVVDGKAELEELEEEVEVEDILTEANNLVNGDRNKTYGHPFYDYSKTSAFWTIILKDKLKEPITPEEAIMCMITLKLSREMNLHKRDNLVDLCGYTQCLQKAIAKRKELEE